MRYESMFTRIRRYPLRAGCAYHTRARPEQIVDDHLHIHPIVAINGNRDANAGYIGQMSS